MHLNRKLFILAIVGLLVNATVWGLSWIAFKGLQNQGLHALWATAGISTAALLVTHFYARGALSEVLRTPNLVGVMLAAGVTNVCFNSAVALGDVVRVTLLFYLMPVWSALLATRLLGEPLTPRALLRMGLGLLGAGFVLWRPEIGVPLPTSLPDVLAIVGGFGFALNNIMLRRAHAASDAARAQAMFLGGAAVCLVLGIGFASTGLIPAPPSFAASTPLYGTLALWALLFLIANYGVQYGAARLPANTTALIMLVEIPIAALSAIALGAATLRWQDVVGGVLIVAAPWWVRDKVKS